MNTVLIVLLCIVLMLIAFAVYICGLISAKLDMMIVLMRCDRENREKDDDRENYRQFCSMMNYTAKDRSDDFE